jgi:hypothetical protein
MWAGGCCRHTAQHNHNNTTYYHFIFLNHRLVVLPQFLVDTAGQLISSYTKTHQVIEKG